MQSTRIALLTLLAASAAAAPKRGDKPAWLGDDLPLPLTVKTPQDLAFKALAERQYLVFNLLANGKVAWDAGDYATAAARWESLLTLPGLDPEIDRVVRPLAVEARTKAGGQAALPPPPREETPAVKAEPKRPSTVTVNGNVSGGGAAGPGGAVVWLRRIDGPTPKPEPATGKTIVQRGKLFLPRVLPVPVGTQVTFRNEDDIAHDVFSLSKPNDFNTNLFKKGGSYQQTFEKPGAVQLLCNIHPTMLGYVVVVDTPWFGQADASGGFAIKGVPPGEYELTAWHEASTAETREKVSVGASGARLAVTVGGDRQSPSFVPDKYGKPRQPQLGY